MLQIWTFGLYYKRVACVFFLQNITTLRVSITDINDNAPVFSSDTYSRSILVKDAKVGEMLLRVSATDKDDGSNANISYRYSARLSYLLLKLPFRKVKLFNNINHTYLHDSLKQMHECLSIVSLKTLPWSHWMLKQETSL